MSCFHVFFQNMRIYWKRKFNDNGAVETMVMNDILYQNETGLTDLLRRSFVCCQDEKRSECRYSRVFSTIRTDKRSSKKR